MPRKLALIVGSLLVALFASACSTSVTDKAISSFPASEVAKVRANAEKNNTALTDDVLLSTLYYRQMCRDISAALGSQTATAWSTLEESASHTGASTQNAVTEGIDRAKKGDASDLRSYAQINCSGAND